MERLTRAFGTRIEGGWKSLVPGVTQFAPLTAPESFPFRSYMPAICDFSLLLLTGVRSQCEALFQNINGFPASRRAVHLLRSEKGAGAQHPQEIAARVIYINHITAQSGAEGEKKKTSFKWTNFIIEAFHVCDI